MTLDHSTSAVWDRNGCLQWKRVALVSSGPCHYSQRSGSVWARRSTFTFPSADLEPVRVELWCSQKAAALLSPAAAAVLHTCEAAAAPSPSVRHRSAKPPQTTWVRLMLRQIILFFPELVEIEEG